MSLRRFLSLSVVMVATASVAFAGPNDKKAPAPAPAPAKEAEPAPAAGSGAGDGSAVAPIEDAPPSAIVHPYQGTDAIRARYGITKQVQLGLTYTYVGVYDDPTTTAKKYAFHV